MIREKYATEIEGLLKRYPRQEIGRFALNALGSTCLWLYEP